MIEISLSDIFADFFGWMMRPRSLFTVTFSEQGYFENVRIVSIEEVADKCLESEPTEEKHLLDNRITCLHNCPRFQEFIMGRPNHKIQYNRKRSNKYQYIGPTIYTKDARVCV